MSRYIKAEKILPYISRLFGAMPVAVLKMAETDGIELVRCKECKYCVSGQCWKADGLDKLDGNVADDDFCSRGVRRPEPNSSEKPNNSND